MDELLKTLHGPKDLKRLGIDQLPQLAKEIRDAICDSIELVEQSISVPGTDTYSSDDTLFFLLIYYIIYISIHSYYNFFLF